MSIFFGHMKSLYSEPECGGTPNKDFNPVALFITQLVIIVTLCRLLAYIFSYIKQPPVIAEVVAGIILGPTVLSSNPEFQKYLFNAKSNTIGYTLNVFANIGLIAFMFLVGLELDPKLLKKNARNSIIISISAMVLPFCLGLGVAALVYRELIPATTKFSSFLLFVAVALSITAFPVLARILAETHMLDDKVGNIALSSAAVDDVVAWCLLALVVALAKAEDGISALYTFLVLVGFIVFMLFGMRRVFVKLAQRARRQRSLNIQILAFMLICTYAFSWFTEVIGVHAIFGAFMTGVITPRENRFAVNITERIEDFIIIILLPLYFTLSGLRTNIRSLNSGTAWGLTIFVIIVATAGKFGGATLAARFTGNTWRESCTVGVLMNAKGLVELIVLNLGLQVGVLNTEVFTMFVIMALVTTFMTTPLVHYIYLRHRDSNVLPKENYNLVMFVPDQKTGMDMVSFAKTIGNPQAPIHVKAIFMNEISDRPSSYFFQLSNKLRNDVPFFKDKASKDLLHHVKKYGKQLGIDVSTKDLNSSDMFEAVKRTSNAYHCDMIVFGLNSLVEKAESALTGVERHRLGDALRQGMASVLDLGIDQVVGSNSPVGEIIRHATEKSLTAIHQPIGVFVSKAHGVTDIRSVAFYFMGNDYENMAWEQILKMPKSVVVSIFTTPDAAHQISTDYDTEKYPSINIYDSAKPVDSLLAAQREGNSADLIILGAERGASNDDLIHIVREANINILVVYPLPSQEKEDTRRPFYKRRNVNIPASMILSPGASASDPNSERQGSNRESLNVAGSESPDQV